MYYLFVLRKAFQFSKGTVGSPMTPPSIPYEISPLQVNLDMGVESDLTFIVPQMTHVSFTAQ